MSGKAASHMCLTWCHSWLQRARRHGPLSVQPTHYHSLTPSPTSPSGFSSICTAPVPGAQLRQALLNGITLYEPFGGLCAGLEAVLRAGFRVNRYLYSDTSSTAVKVSRCRIKFLQETYPAQLSPDAFQDSHCVLPADVRDVTVESLREAGAALNPGQWMVVGGWECQDLSPAGLQAGLQGSRSSTFHDLVRIVGSLQQLQPNLPPLYILENTAMQLPFLKEHIRINDFSVICSTVGAPVLLDAAQVNSHAHRLRNYWINLADRSVLAAVLSCAQRHPGQTVQAVLDAGVHVQTCQRRNQPPWYPANVVGAGLHVLPTLVSYKSSRAFRDGAPGVLLDAAQKFFREPNAAERCRILGYAVESVMGPGVAEDDGHQVTGRAMDAFAMQALVGISVLLVSPGFRPDFLPQTAEVIKACLNAPVAANMMEQQGWCPGDPLGCGQPGLLVPVSATPHPARSGLGYIPVGQQGGKAARGRPPTFKSAGVVTVTTSVSTSNSEPQSDTHDVIALGWSLGWAPPASFADNSSQQFQVTSGVASVLSIVQPNLRPPHLQFHYNCVLAAAAEADDHPPANPQVLITTRSQSKPNPSPSGSNPSPSGSFPSRPSYPHALRPSPLPPVDPIHKLNRPSRDIWLDDNALRMLRGLPGPDLSAAERQRVQRRVLQYLWSDDKLHRRMADGTTREVPPPDQRKPIMKMVHEHCGHFGAARTAHLLLLQYWWYGVKAGVELMVSECPQCSRINSIHFNHTPHELHPLPIEGLFYRWGVDLCGPFPLSTSGFSYVMVCIEHYSKWVELVPLKSKESSEVASAFALHVLSRFGACAEVVTDQGREFEGDFADLLEGAFIDHRTTSANHPQADGLAERMVQTLKRSLKKLVEASGKVEDWADMVPWVALGYRCSPQRSTRFSPYQLLYGVPPTIPPAVKERLQEPLDLNLTPERLALDLQARAALMRRQVAMAGDNLRIAQHRDTLRYAHTRSGAYKPKLRKFEVGDFVYVRRTHQTGLDLPTKPEVLRVTEVRPSGVLVLMGKCGQTIPMHMSQCAPCHLPNLDPTVDPLLARVAVDLPCEVCRLPNDDHLMLLCDSCNTGWHTYCMRPPLDEIPEGDWICPRCHHNGVTLQSLPKRDKTVSRTKRGSDPRAMAHLLHDRWARQQVVVRRGTGTISKLRYGQVRYKGDKHHPRVYEVKWQDGTMSDAMTAAQLGKILLPANFSPPSGIVAAVQGARPGQPIAAVVFAMAFAPYESGQVLPAHLDIRSQSQLSDVMNVLMPGHWNPQHVGKIWAGISAMYHHREHLPRVPTMPAEVEVLLQQVDLVHAGTIVDMWSGTNGIASVLAEHGLSCHTNDLNPSVEAHTHHDALQPGSYEAVRLARGMDCIVISPWYCVLDLAIPLAIRYSTTLVCCHVPGHYFTNAPAPRRAMLKSLADQRRLHIVMSPHRSAMGMRCLWIVVARDSATLRAVLKPGIGLTLSVSM